MVTTVFLGREEAKAPPQPTFHSPERLHLRVRLSRKLKLSALSTATGSGPPLVEPRWP